MGIKFTEIAEYQRDSGGAVNIVIAIDQNFSPVSMAFSADRRPQPCPSSEMDREDPQGWAKEQPCRFKRIDSALSKIAVRNG